MPIDPNNLTEVFDKITVADERAAKSALGIRSDASVRALDVSKLALFVTVQPNSRGVLEVVAHATIPKRDAAALLRQVADAWDQEWKTAERAEQKRLRGEHRG